MAPLAKPLTSKKYQALRRDVRKLMVEADASASLTKLQAYWSVGDRIQRERLAQEAGYHNTVLRDLAQDTGVALRTLQRAVSLRTTYAKTPKSPELTWSHFRVLLQLRSESVRAFYEQLAIRQSLSARELARAVTADLHLGAEQKAAVLERPSSPEYLYAAKVIRIVDGDTLDLEIDLGFDTWIKQRVRLAHIDTPEMDAPGGREARDFVIAKLLAAQTVVIQTRKADLHGRYLGRVFFSAREVGIQKCFSDGVYLNELLGEEGHARVMG